jgi:hypothetical protein
LLASSSHRDQTTTPPLHNTILHYTALHYYSTLLYTTRFLCLPEHLPWRHRNNKKIVSGSWNERQRNHGSCYPAESGSNSPTGSLGDMDSRSAGEILNCCQTRPSGFLASNAMQHYTIARCQAASISSPGLPRPCQPASLPRLHSQSPDSIGLSCWPPTVVRQHTVYAPREGPLVPGESRPLLLDCVHGLTPGYSPRQLKRAATSSLGAIGYHSLVRKDHTVSQSTAMLLCRRSVVCLTIYGHAASLPAACSSPVIHCLSLPTLSFIFMSNSRGYTFQHVEPQDLGHRLGRAVSLFRCRCWQLSSQEAK